MLSADRAKLVEIPSTKVNDGMNILGVVMFSVALGITISRMGEVDGGPLKRFFKSLEGASMKLIALVIW